MKLNYRAFSFAVLAVAVGYYIPLKAQQDPTLMQPGISIPPSPTAASLGKYGEIPVSLYTGVPEISIPLWEVEANGFSMPITLSYHASGIRVEEIAGWVGLGWALNAGGVITRTMFGKPDEQPMGYLTICRSIPNPNVNNGNNFRAWAPSWKNFLYPATIGVSQSRIDTEPDVFSFNFAGRSGKFTIDPYNYGNPGSGNVHVVPLQDLAITPYFETVAGRRDLVRFEAVDESGVQYIFSAVEKTDNIGFSSSGTPWDQDNSSYNSSWLLTEIRTQTETIHITYTPTVEKYDVFRSYTSSLLLGIFPNCDCNEGGYSGYTNKTDVVTKKISQITWSRGRVVFTSAPGRADLKETSGSTLNSISIYNTFNSLERVYKFVYSYTGSGGYTDKRLTLQSVTERGKDGTGKPPYWFTYAPMLPSRNSFAQDHWGYYNGEYDNSLMIPALKYLDNYFDGADRRAHAGYASAGMLTRITYPTGGYTEFEYEEHTYGNIDNSHYGETYGVTDECSVTFSAGGRIKVYSLPFTIAYEQLVALKFTMDPRDVSMLLKICNADNGSTLFSFSSTASYNRELPPGNYQLVIDPGATGALPETTYKAEASLWYDKVTGATLNGIAGGARIKRITSHGGQSSADDIVKEYVYTLHDNPAKSSGVLVSGIPKYYNVSGRKMACTNSYGMQLTGDLCLYLARTSVSQTQVGYTNGSHIGYKEVTVLEGAGGANGSTRYLFTSPEEHPDSVWNSNQKPSNIILYGISDYEAPRTSADWKRGKQLLESVYKADGNTLVTTENEYVLADREYSLPGLRAKILCSNSVTEAMVDSLSGNFVIGYGKYLIKSAWPYLKSTTKTEKRNGSSMVTSTYYEYNPHNLMVASRITTTSTGGDDIVTSRYSVDYLYSEDLVINAMKARRMRSQVVEQVVFRRNPEPHSIPAVISAQQNEYGFFGSMILPSKSRIVEMSEPLLNVGQSDYKDYASYRYDTHGNLIELRKVNDAITAYVWGYNNTLPVARVVGATYDEAVSKVDVDKIQTLVDGDSLRSALSTLRSLSNAMVTTYTYRPLVGITTETDPNGVTTTYEYDDLGRLKWVMDNKERMLQKVEYQYAR